MSKLNIKTTKDIARIRELAKKWRVELNLDTEYSQEEIYLSPLPAKEQREIIEFIDALTKDKTRDDLLRLLWSL